MKAEISKEMPNQLVFNGTLSQVAEAVKSVGIIAQAVIAIQAAARIYFG